VRTKVINENGREWYRERTRIRTHLTFRINLGHWILGLTRGVVGRGFRRCGQLGLEDGRRGSRGRLRPGRRGGTIDLGNGRAIGCGTYILDCTLLNGKHLYWSSVDRRNRWCISRDSSGSLARISDRRGCGPYSDAFVILGTGIFALQRIRPHNIAENGSVQTFIKTNVY